jgi:alpha-mannosidase
LQTGILVQTLEAAAYLASPDIPLFCVNDIVRGRWPKELKLSGGTVFSYVLNNYWHTNYKGTQGGDIRFRYVLTSGSKMAPEKAYRMGWETRQPLYGQRMSFQDYRKSTVPYEQASGGQLAQLESNQAVVTTIKKARFGEGFIVRLQEIAGLTTHASFRISEKRIAKAWLTDLMENDLMELIPEADGGIRIPLKPWGVQTVRFLMENY